MRALIGAGRDQKSQNTERQVPSQRSWPVLALGERRAVRCAVDAVRVAVMPEDLHRGVYTRLAQQ